MIQSSHARATMRAFLEGDAQAQQDFRMLLGELDDRLALADKFPSRHPEKASRRWKAVENFRRAHDL